MTTEDRFWESASLEALSPQQWEALCDGCARCCLHKLADDDTGDVYYTDVACPLLDLTACRCTDYPNRRDRMPACVQLTPKIVFDIHWLPSTCAYRLRALGKPLPRWHHLVSGSKDAVHKSGASVRGKAVLLENPPNDVLMAHVVEMIRTDTGYRLFLPTRPNRPQENHHDHSR